MSGSEPRNKQGTGSAGRRSVRRLLRARARERESRIRTVVEGAPLVRVAHVVK